MTGNPSTKEKLPAGALKLRGDAAPTLGQIARDQFKLFVPAKLIDVALARDAKKNLY